MNLLRLKLKIGRVRRVVAFYLMLKHEFGAMRKFTSYAQNRSSLISGESILSEIKYARFSLVPKYDLTKDLTAASVCDSIQSFETNMSAASLRSSLTNE